MADLGHEVVVYCRKGVDDDAAPTYRGMRRVVLQRINRKHLDTYSHTLLSFLHVTRVKPDVIFAFNASNATLCVIPKLFGYPVILHIDGFDWERPKWSPVGRRLIRGSAWLCSRWSTG